MDVFYTLKLGGFGWSFHVTAALPSAKEPRYPLSKRLGAFWSWSGRFREPNGFWIAAYVQFHGLISLDTQCMYGTKYSVSNPCKTLTPTILQ